MNKGFLGLMLIIVLLVFAGCPIPMAQSAAITDVGWYIDNIDQSFWLTTPPSTHALIYFSIYCSGDVSASDISSVKVTGPDSAVWTLGPSSLTINAQYHEVILSYLMESGHADTMPIGIYVFELTYTDGSKTSYNQLIPAPDSTSTNGYTKVYTQELAPSPPADGTETVRRATLGAHSNSGGTLTINFTVDDSKVYNGYVWLFDSANNYVGSTTTEFRSGSDGGVLPILNGAGSFDTSGGNNTVTFTNGEIYYQSGKTFSDINKFILVLTDGHQYASQGKYSSCDCRSFSERTAF